MIGDKIACSCRKQAQKLRQLRCLPPLVRETSALAGNGYQFEAKFSQSPHHQISKKRSIWQKPLNKQFIQGLFQSLLRLIEH